MFAGVSFPVRRTAAEATLEFSSEAASEAPDAPIALGPTRPVAAELAARRGVFARALAAAEKALPEVPAR